MTHHRLLAALTVAFAVAAVNPANSQTPAANAAASDTKTAGKPASVNGKAIPKSRVDYIALQRAAQGQPDNEQSRRSILDTLITQEILAQEAEKKGYGKSADVVMQVELARQRNHADHRLDRIDVAALDRTGGDGHIRIEFGAAAALHAEQPVIATD